QQHRRPLQTAAERQRDDIVVAAASYLIAVHGELAGNLFGGAVVAFFVPGRPAVKPEQRVRCIRVVDDDTANPEPRHFRGKPIDVEVLDRVAANCGIARAVGQGRGIDAFVPAWDSEDLAGNTERGVVDVDRRDCEPGVDRDAREQPETAPAIEDPSANDQRQHLAVDVLHQRAVTAAQVVRYDGRVEVVDDVRRDEPLPRIAGEFGSVTHRKGLFLNASVLLPAAAWLICFAVLNVLVKRLAGGGSPSVFEQATRMMQSPTFYVAG